MHTNKFENLDEIHIFQESIHYTFELLRVREPRHTYNNEKN